MRDAALWLAGSAAVLLFAGSAAAQTAEPLRIGAFSGLEPGGALPTGWAALTFRSIDRHTRYSLVHDPVQGTVVRAVADASASGLTHRMNLDATLRPMLRWRWKAESLLTRGDITRQDRDDAIARVYVTFAYTPDRMGALDRAKYAASRALFGEYPPHAALNYVWDTRAPVGTSVPSTATSRSRLIVVESGTARVGRWLAYERNVVEDYRRAFGDDPPPFSSIAIMTDSDNTGESVVAHYGDIELAAR